MASLVQRGRVWWVSYRNTAGKRVFKTTRYRRDDDKQNRLAHALEAQLSCEEHMRLILTDDELWSSWVTPFLERHAAQPRTRVRYLAAWREVYAFLRDRGIQRPRDLVYADALTFLTWRTAQARRCGKLVKLNTALTDVRVLGLVMRQAVRLGFAPANPVDRLGVAKESAKEKPELSDQDISTIREALATEPAWMAASFEIALHTGCRQRETAIDFRFIDFERKTITFDCPKGGRSRSFSVPLPESLVERLQALRDAGAARTAELPAMPSRLWWAFFQKIKRSDLCFHCTRVTFVTRMFRAGVPMAAAMKLVNHADSLVHRIYQRLTVEDVRQYANTLSFAAPKTTPSAQREFSFGAQLQKPSATSALPRA